MMDYIVLKNVVGILFTLTGILDALKYSIQARRVQKLKSSKEMSRKFINFALLNDFLKLAYGLLLLDIYIIASSILALICMVDLFWQMYLWYPYRKRGLQNFKRPNLILYIINYWLPNRLRKRL
jgi:uncharacterized protein with PQ loop repeat